MSDGCHKVDVVETVWSIHELVCSVWSHLDPLTVDCCLRYVSTTWNRHADAYLEHLRNHSRPAIEWMLQETASQTSQALVPLALPLYDPTQGYTFVYDVAHQDRPRNKEPPTFVCDSTVRGLVNLKYPALIPLVVKYITAPPNTIFLAVCRTGHVASITTLLRVLDSQVVDAHLNVDVGIQEAVRSGSLHAVQCLVTHGGWNLDLLMEDHIAAGQHDDNDNNKQGSDLANSQGSNPPLHTTHHTLNLLWCLNICEAHGYVHIARWLHSLDQTLVNDTLTQRHDLFRFVPLLYHFPDTESSESRDT